MAAAEHGLPASPCRRPSSFSNQSPALTAREQGGGDTELLYPPALPPRRSGAQLHAAYAAPTITIACATISTSSPPIPARKELITAVFVDIREFVLGVEHDKKWRFEIDSC